MSSLKGRIQSTDISLKGTIIVLFKNKVHVTIWKGENKSTRDGFRWVNYIDGFKYKVVYKDYLCESGMVGYTPYDQILNMLNKVSRRGYEQA